MQATINFIGLKTNLTSILGNRKKTGLLNFPYGKKMCSIKKSQTSHLLFLIQSIIQNL